MKKMKNIMMAAMMNEKLMVKIIMLMHTMNMLMTKKI